MRFPVSSLIKHEQVELWADEKLDHTEVSKVVPNGVKNTGREGLRADLQHFSERTADQLSSAEMTTSCRRNRRGVGLTGQPVGP